MGKDINFENLNSSSEGGFYINIGTNPKVVTGNRLLANIFEVTFMTNMNQSLMSFGYGGDGLYTINLGYDPNDLQSLGAIIQIANDNTVATMLQDQAQFGLEVPAIERIVSASVDSVTKELDLVTAKIKLVPEEYETIYQDNLLVVFPF